MSGPSEAAERVAQNAPRALTHEATIWHALRAAHDPANFEDPMDVSVRLGDVVAFLAGADTWGTDARGKTPATAVSEAFGDDRA